MASENKMSDATSFHQSDAPTLCANGCAFFGNPSTMNLCSKCYRHHQTTATAMAASAPPSNNLAVEAAVMVVEPEKAAAVEDRCGGCNKKVGVMGFKCRCGTTFCGSHRYPEDHRCRFDFKAAARDVIARDNPVVKADKLEERF